MVVELGKFNKENVYAYLKALVKEEVVVFADAENESKFLNILEDNFKPQKGGGASANPPKEIDGVTYHYCRCFKDYLPEDEMVFSGDKCKGISKIGQKLSYDISKLVSETNMKALKAYTSGDIQLGQSLTQEARELEATKDEPQTFIDEKARLDALENSATLAESHDLV